MKVGMANSYNLPALHELNFYGGDFDRYVDALYSLFTRDFIDSKPIFRGSKLRLKYHPELSGKAYTFYHMTHEGNDEENRTPDLRRCERLEWAKILIEKCDNFGLKIWPQKRNGKDRLCIWLELPNEPDYIVILDIRKDYILPWTTFVCQYPNQKAKKQKEYDEYIKAKTAQRG